MEPVEVMMVSLQVEVWVLAGSAQPGLAPSIGLFASEGFDGIHS